MAGVLIIILAFINHCINAATLFAPLAVIYIGLGFIYPNASTIATSKITDKSNASAMMSFINMSIATISVFMAGVFHNVTLVLPGVFCVLLMISLILSWLLKEHKADSY